MLSASAGADSCGTCETAGYGRDLGCQLGYAAQPSQVRDDGFRDTRLHEDTAAAAQWRISVSCGLLQVPGNNTAFRVISSCALHVSAL